MKRWIAGLRSILAALALAVPAALAVSGVLAVSGLPARAESRVEIQVIGSLGGINLYTKQEEPFWSSEIEKITEGRIRATIRPFDRAGLPGAEMLRLIQTGVVPFGTSLVSLVSADEPELGSVDLPALNPDIASLRRTVAAFRPRAIKLLKERYNIELLGIYTYPAQVIFCAKPFTGLADLEGRRIRTASVAQFEVMTALGAMPVNTPFAEVVRSINKGVVDCAITGTLSGNEIGLSEVTTHLHGMAISWGVSIFGASGFTWNRLSPDVRETLKSAVGELENRAWAAAERETMNGIACNGGLPSCIGGRPGKMAVVQASPADEKTRRRLLIEVSLPSWRDRCGTGCAESWNATIAPTVGLYFRKDGTIATAPASSN
jgi:TRAP-type C4-dicarboxylate transport system substrate-binding protein